MKTKQPSPFKALENRLATSFRNLNLLQNALTHSSYKNEQTVNVSPAEAKLLEDNERMEFFGDAILDFVISKRLFELFPEENEGFLSRYRSVLVSKKTLLKIAKRLQIHHFLRLGKMETVLRIKDKTNILADAFEAIIAAVYLDRGMKAAEEFVLNHFSPYLDRKQLKRLDTNENYKSALQEILQKRYHLLPDYKTLEKAGNQFESTVYFKGSPIGKGEGLSKREAEKNAAKEGMRVIKSLKDTP